MSPSQVVAQLSADNVLSLHFHEDVVVVSLDGVIKSHGDVVELNIDSIGVALAVFLVKRKHVINLEASLLDRESLKAMGESMSTQFFLPLREISASDRRHSVLLLPFSEVVGISGWVQTHHLSLHRKNVSSNEG